MSRRRRGEIIEHHAVEFRLADMAIRIESSRPMVHNAARMIDAPTRRAPQPWRN